MARNNSKLARQLLGEKDQVIYVKKIAFRIDDVCPQMDKELFQTALALLEKAGIRPLLCVIPANQDPYLLRQPADPLFWSNLRQLKAQGYLIAMHGYQHLYDSEARCLMTGWAKSEFAGHALAVQLDRLAQGRAIMHQHGLDTDIFAAPGHSFDKNTLQALVQAGFKFISDGRSHQPYLRRGLKFLPCRSYRVAIKCKGLTTVALHPASNGAKELASLHKTLQRNRAYLASFSELLASSCSPLPLQLLDEKIYILYSLFLAPIMFHLKKFIRPLKKIIRRPGQLPS